jgi:ABC-2 type transport system ATP-binding protein
VTAAVGRAQALSPAPTGGDSAVTTHGLTKRFPGGQTAVDSLDLSVPVGSVFGFLGPNGSGKTTTIRMLLGLVSPTAGRTTLLGAPVPQGAAEVLPRVGALVEGPAFHPYLSGRDNLLRLDAGDRTVGARGAALRPRDLLVLDEPTNGLDPQGTREVRALVRDVCAEGTTVFLSSHLLSEVEQVCTHVGVMSHGRLVFQGSLAELGEASASRVRVETPHGEEAVAVLRAQGTGEPEVRTGQVVAELAGVPPERLTAALVSAGVAVRQLVVERPGLEDLFVSLTGEGFDVDG